MTKQTITAFILGAIAITFVFHAYMVYSFRATLVQHDVLLQQIVGLINANQPKK